jgi:hypothetical protein
MSVLVFAGVLFWMGVVWKKRHTACSILQFYSGVMGWSEHVDLAHIWREKEAELYLKFCGALVLNEQLGLSNLPTFD